MFACVLTGLVASAQAQQLDVAVGGTTLWSPKNTSASVGFIPPPEKGGTYPSFSAEYVSDNHWGLGVEGAFRYHQTIYNFFQPYRPILYDANILYTSDVAKKTRADFMAGIGGQTVLFYTASNICGIPAGGCRIYVNSTHFATHLGVGIRYTFWRNFFVRPEAHWYFIPNNFQFHSDNVFRVGASVGYTFGSHPAKTAPAPTPVPAKDTQ